jgi:hypothetical protein
MIRPQAHLFRCLLISAVPLVPRFLHSDFRLFQLFTPSASTNGPRLKNERVTTSPAYGAEQSGLVPDVVSLSSFSLNHLSLLSDDLTCSDGNLLASALLLPDLSFQHEYRRRRRHERRERRQQLLLRPSARGEIQRFHCQREVERVSPAGRLVNTVED